MAGATANLNLTSKEFITFREMIHRASGILYHEGKKTILTTRINRRIRALGLDSVRAYLQHLAEGKDGELELLIEEATTNETYFFRAPQHWQLFTERILKQHDPGRGPLTIWSAAASRGPEPYSAAILAEEHLPRVQEQRGYRILATDISAQILETAARGLFTDRELSRTDRAIRDRYFTRQGDQWLLDPQVRRQVEFQPHNLLDPPPQQGFDLVFLRNVMIYFDLAVKERVLENIYQAVKPGGYLLLGEAESAIGFPHRFSYLEPSFYQRST